MIKTLRKSSRGQKSTRPVAGTKQNWLRKAYRYERAGWLYLHIEGGPKQRGFQHGYLMAAEIGEILKLMQFTTISSTGENFDYFSKAAERLYANLLDSEIAAEIEGIAEGASSAGVSLSFAEALACNANIELLWNWWPMVQSNPPGQPLHRHHHCNALLATGSDVLLKKGRGRIDRNLAKRMIADHYDAALRKHKPGTRSICGHFDEDPSPFAPLGFGPFEPYGANDAKITDSEMANHLSILARFGRSCGQAFNAAAFLRDHPQYSWQAEFLRSKHKQPWTRFASDDKPDRGM
jgi:hypothetical protein